jgi:hypothetical protein
MTTDVLFLEVDSLKKEDIGCHYSNFARIHMADFLYQQRNLLRDEPIADARFGEQVAWVGRVCFQLLTETIDIDTQVFGLTTILRSPDTLKEHPMREDFARVADQFFQDGKFGGREAHLSIPQAHNARGQIDREFAELPGAACGWGNFALSAAQHGAHASQKLFYAKRLRQIIVSAQIERSNFVTLIIQRGQDDNGDTGVFAYTPTDLKTIHTWHHDVQDQQMGTFSLPRSDGL